LNTLESEDSKYFARFLQRGQPESKDLAFAFRFDYINSKSFQPLARLRSF